LRIGSRSAGALDLTVAVQRLVISVALADAIQPQLSVTEAARLHWRDAVPNQQHRKRQVSGERRSGTDTGAVVWLLEPSTRRWPRRHDGWAFQRVVGGLPRDPAFGVLDLAELEHHAFGMRVATVIHLPGLLQIVDHARALVKDVVPPFDPPQVERLLSFRIKRQAVIHGERPTPLSTVIHEAALRIGFGGPKVARAQLEHSTDRSERNHITVRVIPFGTGSYPSSGSTVQHLTGEVSELDSVHLDTDTFTGYVFAQPQLARYRAVLDRLEEAALTPAKSRDLIHDIAQSM
jgi:hypothetical protein